MDIVKFGMVPLWIFIIFIGVPHLVQVLFDAHTDMGLLGLVVLAVVVAISLAGSIKFLLKGYDDNED